MMTSFFLVFFFFFLSFFGLHYYTEEKGIIFLSPFLTKAGEGGLSFAINRTLPYSQGILISVT